MQKSISIFLCSVLTLSVLGCNQINLSKLTQNPLAAVELKATSSTPVTNSREKGETRKKLSEIIATAQPSVDLDGGFLNSLKSAVQLDPRVLAARQDYEAQLASIEFLRGDKDFQFSSTFYGGVEDITDETAGIAIVLNARKTVYDGGILNKSISAEQSVAKAAYQNLLFKMNESAYESVVAWVELERYNSLNDLIDSRLAVLDPLIIQLEKVAEAGVGDKTQVAAAQRMVTMIRVEESDLTERLELAKVNFKNLFGALPAERTFGSELISGAIPSEINQSIALGSPALVGGYENYKAAISRLDAVRAKADFTVGFETKIQRPFGGSNYDSDESVGLVARKTLYDGKKLDNEINRAELTVDSQAAQLQVIYREGKRIVENAQQTIIALNNGMQIAKDNAKASAEEIALLRKQLIIGQSTLETVLAAEARLYDAESKEIQFLSDQILAELSILSTLGLFSPLLGLKE
jgi:adhesin transport system outer membrane protein